MNKEFKKIANNKNETRYVLEFASAGTSSASGIASSPSALGSKDNILIQSRSQTVSVPVTQKPRQGPLRPQTGAGQHRDKKKEQKQGKEKHRKPFAEGVAEGSDYGEPQEVLADVMSTLERQVEWPLTDVMDPREVQSVLQPVRNAINKKLQSLEQGMAEGDNPEYDDEAGMADNNLETLKRAVQGLDDVINTGDNLPEWCQEKIAVAKSMLVTVWDYMLSNENGEPGIAEALSPEDEERQEIVDKLVFAAKTTDSASRELMNLAKDTHSDVADISNNGYAVVMNMVDQLKQYYDFSDIQQTTEDINDFSKAKILDIVDFIKSEYPNLDKDSFEEKLWMYIDGKFGNRFANEVLNNYGDKFYDIYVAKELAEEKIKGVDGKACWKGKRYAGKVKKADGTYKDKCVPVGEDQYINDLLGMLENTIKEKSVSQAQWDLMHAVAHNPAFAAKVGVKQSVGKEFTAADAGRDRSKLPKRVVKKK